MADDEDDEDGAAVALGEGPDVEGAPVARVASRLTWPQERSSVRGKEGEAVLRTPDGPTPLGEVLDTVDETYFDSRQSFLEAVRGVVGTGPVQTAEE